MIIYNENVKKTYRKINQYKSRKKITKEHTEIANLAQLLRECNIFYSQRLMNDNVTFYHCINTQLKFDKFEAFDFASNDSVIIIIKGTK